MPADGSISYRIRTRVAKNLVSSWSDPVITCDSHKSVANGFKNHFSKVLPTENFNFEMKRSRWEDGATILFEMFNESNENDRVVREYLEWNPKVTIPYK